jgi:SagB-type dehydrogenase family enzyme
VTAMVFISLLSLGLGTTSADGPDKPSETSADLSCVEGQVIALPAPQASGGAALMTTLAERHSTRDYKPDALPLQLLSDLLWAASGVSRPREGKRTAATAHNWQSLEVYVATPTGTFRYDPQPHALHPVHSGDLRAATGRQAFVADTPINLVYVSDRSKLSEVKAEEDQILYSGVHAGIVAQNVYLYCASVGLGAVVRASIDKPALEAAMKLPETKRVILAQSVGYPKD